VKGVGEGEELGSRELGLLSALSLRLTGPSGISRQACMNTAMCQPIPQDLGHRQTQPPPPRPSRPPPV
jgi:hypothetical protein